MKLSTLIVATIILLISSCTKDSNKDRVTHNTIINASSHNLKIHVNTNSTYDTIIIPIGESKEFVYSNITESPYPFNGDSLGIFYNDTLAIIHYEAERETVSRNIYSDRYWINERDVDINNFIYKITDDDYKEALEKM